MTEDEEAVIRAVPALARTAVPWCKPLRLSKRDVRKKKALLAREREALSRLENPELKERATSFASVLFSTNRAKGKRPGGASETTLQHSLMERLSTKRRPGWVARPDLG